MLALVLASVILGQDCLQLDHLLGSGIVVSQLPLVADDVFRITFVTPNGCEMVKFLGSLLTLLPSSNRDRVYILMLLLSTGALLESSPL